MKHLIVDKNIEACIECYWYQEGISVCLMVSKNYNRGEYVDDEYSIPDWCPLENIP